MHRLNLAKPRLHTPSVPVPDHAFYVNSLHLIIVKRHLWPQDLYPTSTLYLRKVSDWQPKGN